MNEHELERRVLQLVEDALDREASDRRDYVLRNTADDPRLRNRVLELLSIDDRTGIDIVTGGAIAAGRMFSVPAKIGAYRIERELGRGGMGSVYLGRRTTDDFDHTVAIKVVRQNVASDRYVHRLRAERQTLARLRHPNIAQLHDGGEMPDGAPYVVMEYVDGVRLDHYLTREPVDLSRRLAMFRQICQAVSYAHRNLIIHRDLSPANVLVGDDLQVKLIDFGIAHSLEESGELHADNRAPQFTMTKGYAAPERAAGAASSTATDIYSLGKILADLIADQKVPRRRDLEAVIARACADTPEVRYPTADALLEEVEAYSAGSAVEAVNGGWAYRLTRFVGRRKLAVGVGAVFVLAAIATSIVMSVLYLRADTAERQASERFEELRALAGFMIFELHDELAGLDGSTPAREKLIKTALQYLDTLGASRNVSDHLRLEIARGYKRLSDVTGNPSGANLGRRALASQLLQKAATQIQDLWSVSRDEDVVRAYAEIMSAYALQGLYSARDQRVSYERLLSARLALSELATISEPTLADRLLDAHVDLAIGYSLEQPEEGVTEIRKSLSKYEALARQHPDDASVLMRLAQAHVTLGEKLSWKIYYDQEGDYVEVLPHFDNGVNMLHRLVAANDFTPAIRNQLVVALFKRANTTCYMESPFPNHGLDDLEEAMRLVGQWVSVNPNDRAAREHKTLVTLQQSACHANVGEFDEAIRLGNTAVSDRRAALAENPGNPGSLLDLINTMWTLSTIYQTAGDDAGACLLGEQANELVQVYIENQSARSQFTTHQFDEIAILMTECREKAAP